MAQWKKHVRKYKKGLIAALALVVLAGAFNVFGQRGGARGGFRGGGRTGIRTGRSRGAGVGRRGVGSGRRRVGSARVGRRGFGGGRGRVGGARVGRRGFGGGRGRVGIRRGRIGTRRRGFHGRRGFGFRRRGIYFGSWPYYSYSSGYSRGYGDYADQSGYNYWRIINNTSQNIRVTNEGSSESTYWIRPGTYALLDHRYGFDFIVESRGGQTRYKSSNNHCIEVDSDIYKDLRVTTYDGCE